MTRRWDRVIRAVNTLTSPGQLDLQTLVIGSPPSPSSCCSSERGSVPWAWWWPWLITSAGALVLGWHGRHAQRLGVVASSLPRPERRLLGLVPALIVPRRPWRLSHWSRREHRPSPNLVAELGTAPRPWTRPTNARDAAARSAPGRASSGASGRAANWRRRRGRERGDRPARPRPADVITTPPQAQGTDPRSLEQQDEGDVAIPDHERLQIKLARAG